MEEPLLENLLIRQRIVATLKEELSRSSSWVIILILLFLLIQTLFFNNSIIMFPISGLMA